jgi:hypothetical protein
LHENELDHDHDEDTVGPGEGEDEHGKGGRIAPDSEDFGIKTMVIFGLQGRTDTSPRAGRVFGPDEPDLDNRRHVSPMST